jgi:hypothetical protein
MRPHRFDPFSLVIGLSTAGLGALLLWGDPDLEDLRPGHLWPFPLLILGLLLTLYGVRRLLDGARHGPGGDGSPGDEVVQDAESSSSHAPATDASVEPSNTGP